MTYRRKPKSENQSLSQKEEIVQEKIKEVEENIKRAIQIDQMIEETLEKLESVSEAQDTPVSLIPKPGPTGKIFMGEEDKRLLKKFNKYIVKKLGINPNRSFKI